MTLWAVMEQLIQARLPSRPPEWSYCYFEDIKNAAVYQRRKARERAARRRQQRDGTPVLAIAFAFGSANASARSYIGCSCFVW